MLRGCILTSESSFIGFFFRIWLVKRDKHSVRSKNEKPQQITCHDFIPEGEDTIPKLVHRANKRIENGTIDGNCHTYFVT